MKRIKFSLRMAELLDNMYELVDNLTYKTRSIAPNMWPVFELSCNLFKSEAIDFLDGTFIVEPQ